MSSATSRIDKTGPGARQRIPTPNPITGLSREGLAVDATHEEWRPVVGFEGLYEVSNLGRVRSLDHFARGRSGSKRLIRGRVLRPAPRTSGHLTVALGRNGGSKDVHTLVATAFIGPRPEGMECCHQDGDPTNNRVENLRWDTRSANRLDSVRHGTHQAVKKTHCKHGHEFTPENTLVQRGKHRRCRECHRLDSQKGYPR
ncbi:HNH endonuclease [Mycobacterium phage Ramsey]|uniref:HNH endonuclease n=1 Tax=Mycobacterium phage Ramsey TaxID=2914020 RepID=B5U5I0_9CAUD|nr:HNH endonuclease [Mycobacterium phage Ramsey]ACI12645.1 HNH endonuclease [Mycobacterium phage Ramsey]